NLHGRATRKLFRSHRPGGVPPRRALPAVLIEPVSFRCEDGAIVTTERGERASLAPWADRAADVLSEADEEFIDVKPEFFRAGLHETLFRLFRGFRADQTEPVADPVHVGVRGNPRFAEPVHEHAVRRLRPDLRKRNKFIDVPGDCAADVLVVDMD